MKSTPRTRKLGVTVREAIASIIQGAISDPRLDLITVTSVEVSSDLSVANVYVTAHGDEERYAEVLEGLESAKGRIRHLLGKAVKTRITPDLRFFIDSSVDAGFRMSVALKTVPPTLANAEHSDEDDTTEG